jgi:hypothetical protein
MYFAKQQQKIRTMLRTSLLLSLFAASLCAQPYPKLYSQLGDKLFAADAKFSSLNRDKELEKRIVRYRTRSEQLRRHGLQLEADAPVSPRQTQAYLTSLRALQKEYENILHPLRQRVLESIKNDDYETFSRLTGSAMDDLFAPPSLQAKALSYYQRHKEQGAIPLLDAMQRRADAKHAARQNSRLLAQRHQTAGALPDQENLAPDGTGGLEITRKQTVAQTFTIKKRGKLVAVQLVDVRPHRCTPKSPLYVTVTDTRMNGEPGSYRFYTGAIPPDEVSNPLLIELKGNDAPSVRPGEQYAVTIGSDAEPSSCTYAWGGGYETYDGGKTYVNGHENFRDMRFRSFVSVE